MAEYIEREEVMLQIDAADFVRDNNFEGGAALLFYDDVWDRLSAIDAADVRPVVRGKWTQRKSKLYTMCSACGYGYSNSHYHEVEKFKFCPNCGADMREES